MTRYSCSAHLVQSYGSLAAFVNSAAGLCAHREVLVNELGVLNGIVTVSLTTLAAAAEF